MSELDVDIPDAEESSLRPNRHIKATSTRTRLLSIITMQNY